jgi:S-disulfanyl-L-cysteine oxidoreductase SoxD
MVSRRLLLVSLLLFGMCGMVSAQTPTYGIGRAPNADELRAFDISISPTGKELPQGRGTAKEGAQLYVQKGCAGCHAPNGYGGRAPMLIKPETASVSSAPCLSPCISESNLMALHSPFATVIWDYINRGMPLGKEGSLKSDEVYALTAFLLFKNGVIKEDDVIDAQSLPKVNMPNRNGFALPAEEWKPGRARLQGYP